MFQVVDGTLIGLGGVTLESREDLARHPVRICPVRKVPMKRIIVLSALLAAACGFILSSYFEDTVGINIEGYFDLRDTTGGWWNTIKDESAK